MEKKLLFLGAMVGSLVLMSSCGGPKETQGGLLGATAGAAIGAAVAGDEGEGALIGGLLGGLVGREMGRASDERDQQKEHASEIQKLEKEKRALQRELTRWCGTCGRSVRIRGAQSCPDCGGELIHEKFCQRCKTTFSPDTGYRFCPYCKVKVRLKSR